MSLPFVLSFFSLEFFLSRNGCIGLVLLLVTFPSQILVRFYLILQLPRVFHSPFLLFPLVFLLLDSSCKKIAVLVSSWSAPLEILVSVYLIFLLLCLFFLSPLFLVFFTLLVPSCPKNCGIGHFLVFVFTPRDSCSFLLYSSGVMSLPVVFVVFRLRSSCPKNCGLDFALILVCTSTPAHVGEDGFFLLLSSPFSFYSQRLTWARL